MSAGLDPECGFDPAPQGLRQNGQGCRQRHGDSAADQCITQPLAKTAGHGSAFLDELGQDHNSLTVNPAFDMLRIVLNQ